MLSECSGNKLSKVLNDISLVFIARGSSQINQLSAFSKAHSVSAITLGINFCASKISLYCIAPPSVPLCWVKFFLKLVTSSISKRL